MPTRRDVLITIKIRLKRETVESRRRIRLRSYPPRVLAILHDYSNKLTVDIIPMVIARNADAGGQFYRDERTRDRSCPQARAVTASDSPQ